MKKFFLASLAAIGLAVPISGQQQAAPRPATPASPDDLVFVQEDLRPYEEAAVHNAEKELDAWSRRLRAIEPAARSTEAYAEDFLRFEVAYGDATSLNRWNETHTLDIALPPEPPKAAQDAVRDRWKKEVAEREEAIARAEKEAAEREAELRRRQLDDQARRLTQDQLDEQRRITSSLRDEIDSLRRDIDDSRYAIWCGTAIIDSGFRIPTMWPQGRPAHGNPFLPRQGATTLLPDWKSGSQTPAEPKAP